MKETRTRAALAGIKDDGEFEEIATAVLRIAEPLCHGLAHPGVNPDGRTKKSPVDAVCYAPDDPNHLIVVHHTVAKNLRPKWLLDPATVKRSRRSKSEPVAGDVVKTIELVKVRRRRNPKLKATLILTTSREIDEDLMSEVVAIGADAKLMIDFWSGSRLAHVLDNDPDGQWLRRQAFGAAQALLSSELLADLSNRSVLSFRAGDTVEKRVPREFEDTLQMQSGTLILVVGPSGFGKTVACHSALTAHVESGGFGLVLDHSHLEDATSLEQALQSALKDFEPELSASSSALALASDDRPLLILVEDISRSREPGRLLDKLIQWAGNDGVAKSLTHVRLLCPVWPHLLALGSGALERQREAATFRAPRLSTPEARGAVRKAAEVDGEALSIGQADAIAGALGRDPLLIGLNRNWSSPDPASVMAEFVEAAILRSCAGSAARASRGVAAFEGLGREMILRRQLSPTWTEVQEWSSSATVVERLETIIDAGELLWLEGVEGRIQFRHDRVKAWLLARAANALKQQEGLSDALVSEPAYAEIIGDCLVLDGGTSEFIQRVSTLNPLALFTCLARPGSLNADVRLAVAEAAKAWLRSPDAQSPGRADLRWEAMNVLEYAQGSHIPAVVDSFTNPNPAALIAKFRSGDVEGGVAVCQKYGLRSVVYWLPRPIEVARDLRGNALLDEVAEVLRKSETGSARRRAALILTGAVGDPALSEPLRSVWSEGQDQDDLLREYLWAFARCATPASAREMLEPVCARWAALPAPEHYSPSDKATTIYDLAAYEVRQAFHRLPPKGAIDYFIGRAKASDLAWPIQYMLHGLDLPKVVRFIVEVLAEVRADSTTAYSTSSLRSLHTRGLWDETQRPMSEPSREVLRAIWGNVAANPDRRIAAFDWWAASRDPRDFVYLRALKQDAVLADRALQNRLERGDVSAHTAFVGKLRGQEEKRWWWYAARSWSPILAAALRAKLDRLLEAAAQTDFKSLDISHTLAEILISIGRSEAETILLRYWPLLKTDRKFVQVALFLGTPELLRLAEEAITSHPDPSVLFKYLSMTWGIKYNGHGGVQRPDQIEALGPYLDHLSEHELDSLAENCNERGWFDMRRRLLDPAMPNSRFARTRAEVVRVMEGALNKPFPMSFELDHALKTGLRPADLIAALAEWLPTQRSRSALRVATAVLHHSGGRGDVELLRLWTGEDQLALEDTLANTSFAVARRTL